jgi:hypothetical protein
MNEKAAQAFANPFPLFGASILISEKIENKYEE